MRPDFQNCFNIFYRTYKHFKTVNTQITILTTVFKKRYLKLMEITIPLQGFTRKV